MRLFVTVKLSLKKGKQNLSVYAKYCDLGHNHDGGILSTVPIIYSALSFKTGKCKVKNKLNKFNSAVLTLIFPWKLHVLKKLQNFKFIIKQLNEKYNSSISLSILYAFSNSYPIILRYT